MLIASNGIKIDSSEVPVVSMWLIIISKVIRNNAKFGLSLIKVALHSAEDGVKGRVKQALSNLHKALFKFRLRPNYISPAP